MNRILLAVAASCLLIGVGHAQTNDVNDRALWASINGAKNASLGDYQQHTGKVLVTWRMLPADDANTSFDLYRAIGKGAEKRIASKIKNRTCYQDGSASTTADNHYRLTYAGSSETLSEFTLTKAQVAGGLPYVSIPLADTKDVYENTAKVVYTANDVSVGDLDGDGEFELVVKRLQSVKDANGNVVSDGSGASYSQKDCLWAVIWDAYKLDGTLLWRVKGGPGIILGNSSSFAVADFDGDGCAEMAIRTCEGTVFGDGEQIGDTNNDGKIDYRTWGNQNSSSPGWVDHYNSAGPEFISIIDGRTGRELARDNFINRETSSSWGDDYWKRACSFRVGVGCFDETGLPSAVFGRGVYGHSVIEAWDWRNGQLTRRWRFDTNDRGTGKDGKKHSTYAAQGNHSLNVADLDGDGLDEVMYGSMAVDDDGIGLWNTRLGHGDANHVGKFLPGREGLQMFHCLETGKTMVALHDARDGSVIWKKDAADNNDTGRCMVADYSPATPGCEFCYYKSDLFNQDGNATGISTANDWKPGFAAAIWFDGTLSRQGLSEDGIIHSVPNGRTFTMWRYSMAMINGTKGNPSWYGDLVGDWREEIILPDATRLADIKIFSTWYPTTHKFPWLMTDHCYWMSCLNQNVGYNQPTNTGYYLGSDIKKDAEAWEEAKKVQNKEIATGISQVPDTRQYPSGQEARDKGRAAVYDLQGRSIGAASSLNAPLPKGVYIFNGKKIVRQ
jgi:rhamnogalacturonan endolyase